MTEPSAPIKDFRQATWGQTTSNISPQPYPYYINPQQRIQQLTEDNADLRERNEQLMRLAFVDALTEIPNRNALNLHIEERGEKEQIPRSQIDDESIVFIDLDRFKDINDTYGHANGDLVLKAVADALLNEIRKDDRIFRLGGDEFVLLLNHAKVEDVNRTVARHVEQLLEKGIPVELTNGETVLARGTIGVFPIDHTLDFHANLMRADKIMYDAKGQRKLSEERHRPETASAPAPAAGLPGPTVFT